MKTKILALICGLCCATMLNAQKYEAEDAQFTGGTAGETDPAVVEDPNASAGKYVQTRDGNLTFTITIASDGFYDIDVYGNGPDGVDRENGFKIDGGNNISIKFPPESDGAYTRKSIVRGHWLTAGQHTIEMIKSWGYVSIDYIDVETAEVIVYEAEAAEIVGGTGDDIASTEAHGAASGGMVLSTKESSVKFNIFIANPGKYDVNVYVIGDGEASTREALFYIDETHALLEAGNQDWTRRYPVMCDGDPNESIRKTIVSDYEFTAGEHYVFLDKATDPGAWGWYKLDYLELIATDVLLPSFSSSVDSSNEFIVSASDGVLNIAAGNGEVYDLSVYDVMGKSYYVGHALSGNTIIPSIRQSGIYLVRIESAAGVHTSKVKL